MWPRWEWSSTPARGFRHTIAVALSSVSMAAGTATCSTATKSSSYPSRTAARRGSPPRRAALYAVAAGITWALEATLIKATTDTLTQFGVGGMFLHWPVYAVAAGGAAGVLLEQEALHVGPLRVSQPVMVIIDPVVSIALSVWLFGEHFVPDGWVLAAAAAGFAAMCVGVVYLTRKAPETMEAGVRDPATALTP